MSTIPCRICGEPTIMLGTKLCDRCWELEGRIKSDPEIALKILNAIGKNTQLAPPVPVNKTLELHSNPDFTQVHDLCKAYIGSIENHEHVEETGQYIFEAAMEACYGSEVWPYINSRL